MNRREKGRGGDALLDWRKSCNTPCQKLLILEGHGGERGRAPENKPKDVPFELGITAVMVPSELGITAVMVPSELGITTVMVPSELGITAVMGARSEEVSNGSVDVEEGKEETCSLLVLVTSSLTLLSKEVTPLCWYSPSPVFP